MPYSRWDKNNQCREMLLSYKLSQSAVNPSTEVIRLLPSVLNVSHEPHDSACQSNAILTMVLKSNYQCRRSWKIRLIWIIHHFLCIHNLSFRKSQLIKCQEKKNSLKWKYASSHLHVITLGKLTLACMWLQHERNNTFICIICFKRP